MVFPLHPVKVRYTRTCSFLFSKRTYSGRVRYLEYLSTRSFCRIMEIPGLTCFSTHYPVRVFRNSYYSPFPVHKYTLFTPDPPDVREGGGADIGVDPLRGPRQECQAAILPGAYCSCIFRTLSEFPLVHSFRRHSAFGGRRPHLLILVIGASPVQTFYPFSGTHDKEPFLAVEPGGCVGNCQQDTQSLP